MIRRSNGRLNLALTSIILLLTSYTIMVNYVIFIPDQTRMVVGERKDFSIPLPRSLFDLIKLTVERSSDSAAANDQAIEVNRNHNGFSLQAKKPGKTDISLTLLGYIPIKSIYVESLEPRKMVAGGHSIGVVLQSQGIMVVGMAPVSTESDKKLPAKDKGIQVGDLIMKVNGKAVYSEKELSDIINESGKSNKPVVIAVKRNKVTRTYYVRSIYCTETGRYRIGLYVRDGVAGVGTLTFWDPLTSKFAALGHIIIDSDTKKVVSIRKGKIVEAAIKTIQPGCPGSPGEKIGIFEQNGGINGSITANTYYGIFGVTNEPIGNSLYPDPIPVAYAYQIKKGPAEILTVINDKKIERFKISIEKIYPYRRNGKGLIVKVIDSRLTSLTGGIVQGMSGSPIIQDGRLVGAITHVFLNNPQKGYGIFMDPMLEALENVDSSYRQIAQ